jgi:hypothetical protein
MMDTSDTNARFEFNCGKASGNLFFDDISLVPEYVAQVKYVPYRVAVAGYEKTGSILFNGYKNGHQSLQMGPETSFRCFDLKGRAIGTYMSGNGSVSGRPSGWYVLRNVGRPGNIHNRGHE